MYQTLTPAQVMQMTAPHGYMLVVAVDQEGRPNAMGASWWMFTSMKPMMVAVSIAPTRHTHDIVRDTKEFILVAPSAEQAEAAWLCGTKSGRDLNKFDEAGFEVEMAEEVRAPLILDASVALEVRVTDSIVTGDHTLFTGEVVAAHGDADRVEHLFHMGAKLMALNPDGQRRDVNQ